MTRHSASTTSPICSGRRPRCSSAISSLPIASARWPSALPSRLDPIPIESGRTARRISTSKGLPLGTVGGLVVNHTFPLDAEYKFSLALYRTNLEAIRGLEHPHQIEITVDGERVFLMTVGGEPTRRARRRREHHRAQRCRRRATPMVSAGEGRTARGRRLVRAQDWRRHAAAAAVSSQLRRDLRLDRPSAHRDAHHCRSLQSDGTGRHAEPAAHLLLPALRKPVQSGAAHEEACATKILSTLARRAYRRPVTKADTARLLTFYRAGRAKGSFDTGIQMALRRLLASPNFVFRVEEDAHRQAGHAPARERHRARLAAVLLPLEQHPGRCPAGSGESRTAAQPGGARA